MINRSIFTAIFLIWGVTNGFAQVTGPNATYKLVTAANWVKSKKLLPAYFI